MDKSAIRKSILNNLKNLSTEYVKNSEEIIYIKLFSNEIFNKSKCIALTIPFGTEINTYPIIEYLLKNNKIVCSPVCIKETREMIFYRFDKIDDLVEGYYGIKTPPEIKENIVDKNSIDLIIVPGVGFDKDNYRIGFGGGYYDRYLQDFNGSTISLALKEQIIEKVPTNQFDLPVQIVITN